MVQRHSERELRFIPGNPQPGYDELYKLNVATLAANDQPGTHTPLANSRQVERHENGLQYWFRLEDDSRLNKYRQVAHVNLNSLMATLKHELASDPRTVGEKITRVYKILEREGYTLKPFPLSDPLESSLIYNMAKKRIDCDTSSGIISAVAEELGWKDVKWISVPEHAFIRWEGKNFDYGMSPDDDYYVETYGVNPKKREQAVEIGVRAAGWLARGVLAENRKDYKQAAESYSEAIHLAPLDALAWTNRGNANLMRGYFKEALADNTEAIRLAPTYALARSNLGEANLKLGHIKKALADSNQAILLNPQSKEGWILRSKCKRALGMIRQAEADRKVAESLK